MGMSSRACLGGMVAMASMLRVGEEANRRRVEVTALDIEFGDDAIIPLARLRLNGREVCVRVWSDGDTIGASVEALGRAEVERVEDPTAARIMGVAVRMMGGESPEGEPMTPAQARAAFIAGLGRSRPDGLN